jgi:hypothetical protein
MPFKSKKQRAFLYSQHPEIAEEFERHTPKGAKLPLRVKPKKKKKKTVKKKRKIKTKTKRKKK